MKWCYMLVYKKSELAQGLIEYALVLVLVSIVVFLALSYMGPSLGNLFSNIGDALENA